MAKVVDKLWIEKDQEVYTIGVTEAFQEDAGDIAYVNIAPLGAIVQEDTLFNIEASKATIEVPSPVSGTIIEINERILQEPSLLDETSRDVNWVVKVTSNDSAFWDSLEDEA